MEQCNLKTEPDSEVPLGQQILNGLIVHFWISPLVVIYWVSTWMLQWKILIFPNDIYKSIWWSFGIGYGLQFIASCGQNNLLALASSHGIVCREVVKHMYTYVLAFAWVNQWRFVWQALDVYTDSSMFNGWVTTVATCIPVVFLRCTSQLLAPPVVLAYDFPIKPYFVMTSYFNTEVGTWRHVLDSAFSVFVVQTLKPAMWRGVWDVFNHAFTPNNLTTSALCSLALAYPLNLLLLLSRSKWASLSRWTDGRCWLWKYCVEDFYILLKVLVCISFWRGYWLLYTVHVVDPPLRYWIGHAVPFALLSMTLASNSLLARGCAKDCLKTDGQSILLEMDYVSHYLKVWNSRHEPDRKDYHDMSTGENGH